MSKKNNDSAPREPVETPAPVATPAPTEAPVATSAPVDPPATPEPTSAPVAAPEPEPTPAPAPPPWRTVAIARRECTIAYRDGNARYLGGEWETSPGRVEQLAGCEEYFRFVPVESQEHLEYLQNRFARDTELLREAAREMGYVLVRDGEPLPKR